MTFNYTSLQKISRRQINNTGKSIRVYPTTAMDLTWDDEGEYTLGTSSVTGTTALGTGTTRVGLLIETIKVDASEEKQGIENLNKRVLYLRDNAIIAQGDVVYMDADYYEIVRINEFKPGDTVLFNEIEVVSWEQKP